MYSSSNRIVFFGSEEFSAPSLTKLIEDGWEIEAVITKPDSRRGRSKQLVAPLVKQIAEKHHIQVLQPQSKKELATMTKKLASKLGVLVSYGLIIPQEVLDHFLRGIVNVHPSKLPILRGPAPIEFTILEGKSDLWVSIMKLDAGMDTGPVYLQEMRDIAKDVTGPQLNRQAAKFGALLLSQNLPDIASGDLKPTAQSESGIEPTHSTMLSKDMSKLDPIHKTAGTLEREIRAFAGWPGSKIEITGTPVTVIQAHSLDSSFAHEAPGKIQIDPIESTIWIHCAKNTALRVDRLKPAGKNEMSAADFMNGLNKSQ